MNLIARYVPGKREPEYLDPNALKALKGSGKHITRIGDELWGPFDTLEEALAFEKPKDQATVTE